MSIEPPIRSNLGEGHPLLQSGITRLQMLMMAIGHPIRPVEVWRSHERQQWLYERHINAGGPQAAPPGKSKHEHTNGGLPCALACDVCFTGPGVDPYGEGNPWGTLRMVATELCGLSAISQWDGQDRRFEGDRPHFEVNP